MENNKIEKDTCTVTQYDALFQHKLDVWTSHAILYDAYKEGFEAAMLKTKGYLTTDEKNIIKERAINYARKTRIAEAKRTREMVINSHKAGISIETIAQITNLTVAQITEILKMHQLTVN